jgi:beta-1,4-mannosyltransferase
MHITPTVGIASFPPVLGTNPYQRLLYGHLADHGYELVTARKLTLGWLLRSRRSVAVLHFHWLEPYYRHRRGPAFARRALSWVRMGLFAGRLAAARLLGYRIAWTVHQVFPHESTDRRLERVAAATMARMSHVLVAHDLATAEVARRELGRAAGAIRVVPHGSYAGVYPEGRPRRAVRAELGVPTDAFAFLAFGHVRAYKHLGLLLDAFAGLEHPDAVLIVAGPVLDEDAAASVRSAAARDPRIRPVLGFIADDRVAELFAASDAAVVSRSDGGTSGALVLALSLGLPVVAAALPAYEELLGGEDAGWLFTAGDRGSLRDALARAAADPEAAAVKRAAALRSADALPWTEAASRLAALIGDGSAVVSG